MSTTSDTDISSAPSKVVLQAQPTKPATPATVVTDAKEAAAPKSDSAIKSFISGGVGGACAVLVGHPFDLVKVRMQTAGGGGANTSVFGMLSTTMKREGVRGLYR